jgi:hypothetical protein
MKHEVKHILSYQCAVAPRRGRNVMILSICAGLCSAAAFWLSWTEPAPRRVPSVRSPSSALGVPSTAPTQDDELAIAANPFTMARISELKEQGSGPINLTGSEANEVARLFPGIGRSRKESPIIGLWMTAYRIEMTRSDGQQLQVCLDPGLLYWREFSYSTNSWKGDWQLSPESALLLRNLLRTTRSERLRTN